MSQRFEPLAFNEESKAVQQKFRDLLEVVEYELIKLPNTYASKLAFTKLEESYMWIGKAIRDKQTERSV